MADLTPFETSIQYKPRLSLAKPDGTVISVLSEAHNVNSTLRLDNLNELTFDIPIYVEEDHDLILNPNFDLIKNRYLIKLETTSIASTPVMLGSTPYTIGSVPIHYEEWYVITTPNKKMDENSDMLNVNALSLAYQLNDKLITVYPVDPLESPKNATSILGIVLADTVWSVGHVTADFDLKFRSFEFSNINVLNCIQQIATTMEGIVTWDTVNKKVNLYLPEEVGVDKGLRLDYGKYLRSFDYGINPDNFCTRLRVYGKDGLTISGANPTGLTYIDDFGYFLGNFSRTSATPPVVLTHSDYMSDSLCNALLDYAYVVESHDGDFQAILFDLETNQEVLTTLTNEMDTLNEEMAVIDNDIDIAQSQGEDTTSLHAQKVAKQGEIDSKQDAIDAVNAVISDLYSQSEDLADLLSTENNFTGAQILELNPYIIEKIVTNSNISIDKDLYEWGLSQFIKINTPDLVFSITLANFLQFLDPASMIEASEFGLGSLGDTVRVVNSFHNLDRDAKITEIRIAYESSEMSFVLTDIQSINRDKDKLLKLIKNMNMTTNSVNLERYKWNQAVTASSSVEQILNEAWDATARNINAGVEQTVQLNARGLTCFPTGEPNKLIRITNGSIGLSLTGGETYSVAIDATGVYAPRLVGQILLGENLYIDSGSGIFSVNESGVYIDGTALIITNTQATPPAGSLNYMLQELEGLIGGNTTKWFGDYVPTLSNIPASNWTNQELKTTHLGDLFYYTATPNAQYRFSNYSSTPENFFWALISENNNNLSFDYTYSNQVRVDTIDGIVVNKVNGWGDIVGRTVLNGVNGIAIQKNTGTNENPNWGTQLYMDTGGDLILTGKIIRGDIDTGQVFKVDDDGIYLGSNSFVSAPFRVNMDGELYSENAEIQGIVNASDLQIDGVSIMTTINGIKQIDPSAVALQAANLIGLGHGEVIEYCQAEWQAGDIEFHFVNKYDTKPTYVISPSCNFSGMQDGEGKWYGVRVPADGHDGAAGTIFNLIAIGLKTPSATP